MLIPYLNCKDECHPLIISRLRIVLFCQCLITFLLDNASHVVLNVGIEMTFSFIVNMYLVLWGNVGAAVHPAVVICQLLVNCAELARYGLTEIRLSHANHGSNHADDGGHFVEQFEHPVVNADLIEREVGDKIRQDMRGHDKV